jgi:hypothetical protein
MLNPEKKTTENKKENLPVGLLSVSHQHESHFWLS